MAGEVIRAIAWLGPQEVDKALRTIEPKLSVKDLEELAESRAIMPAWIAEPVSAMVASG
jgi:hypothetical protein